MKRLFLGLSLLATPAFAQQPQPAPAAGMRAWQMMMDQASLREQNATSVAMEQADKVADLTKERDALKQQLTDLTKEIETLKTTTKPSEKSLRLNEN